MGKAFSTHILSRVLLMQYLLNGNAFNSVLRMPQLHIRFSTPIRMHLSQSRVMTKNQVIILAGATSVGKSAVARELCKSLDAEIVIADSVQIYRHLDIGSNKPSKTEMHEIPHHLVDICEPSQIFSCGDFVRRASVIIDEIISRGKVPVVVGGSTMWIQWLVHGIPDAPKADGETVLEVNAMLKEHECEGDWNTAVKLLAEYDPNRAYQIGKNDWYRLHRFLEVAVSMRKNRGINSTDEKAEFFSLTGQRTPLLSHLDLRCFFLSEDREQLYRCIDMRCEDMLRMGLFEEVTQLILDGTLTPETPSARAIGYRQTIDYLCNPRWEALSIPAFNAYVM